MARLQPMFVIVVNKDIGQIIVVKIPYCNTATIVEIVVCIKVHDVGVFQRVDKIDSSAESFVKSN
jgi:hypothetical protein